MVNLSKKKASHQDEKCQLKATAAFSSLNDKETLTPLGRLQVAPKQHYTRAQRNGYLYVLQ